MASHGALSEQDISALQLQMSMKRANSGLTYDALATKSGVSRRTLISIETGTSRGSLDSWMRIYNALDTDFGAFLHGLKNPPPLENSKNLYPEMPLAEYIVQNETPSYET
ncbi:hypothetical protein GCM10027022_03520 [Alpinimonas psychrophila]|uniref:Transcriptional regulator with XRE-family HTH domain n=1 Tax=Alpinimonas psychrophila TaxID=748908 RepID=A0A7W3JRZ7_9MICO|nr:helix-turn-helix transcriptional regulator [Alpinimonas psychrophila]MBA8828164.1 transcriptional regulator with XRE-family HTH domain [Alpinimonas psychrophila]